VEERWVALEGTWISVFAIRASQEGVRRIDRELHVNGARLLGTSLHDPLLFVTWAMWPNRRTGKSADLTKLMVERALEFAC
jgi:hypothetical protein